MKIKGDNFVKSIFFDIIDDAALELIGKRVSRMNGDVRVAFDVMKTCLNKLYNKVKYDIPEEELDVS